MIEAIIQGAKPNDYEFEYGLPSDRNLNAFTHLKRLWLNPVVVQETYTDFGHTTRTAQVDMYHELLNTEAGATTRDTLFALVNQARTDAFGTVSRIFQHATIIDLENIRHEPVHQDTQQVYCGVRTRLNVIFEQDVDCGEQIQPQPLSPYVLPNYVAPNYTFP